MQIKATYAALKGFPVDYSRALREEVRSLVVHAECIQAIEAQGLIGFRWRAARQRRYHAQFRVNPPRTVILQPTGSPRQFGS